MIPIKDYNPTRRKARVVPAILIFNVIVFLWELGLGSDRTAAVYYFGVVPRFFTDPALREQLGALHLIQSLFTTLFMHGGWFHLLANMWTLFVFGDNVEDRLGVSRFILLYFLAWPPVGWKSWSTRIRKRPSSAPVAPLPASWAPTCASTPKPGSTC